MLLKILCLTGGLLSNVEIVFSMQKKEFEPYPEDNQGLSDPNTPEATHRPNPLPEEPMIDISSILSSALSQQITKYITLKKPWSFTQTFLDQNPETQTIKIINIKPSKITVIHNRLKIIDVSYNSQLTHLYIDCPAEELIMIGCSALQEIFFYDCADSVKIYTDGCQTLKFIEKDAKCYNAEIEIVSVQETINE